MTCDRFPISLLKKKLIFFTSCFKGAITSLTSLMLSICMSHSFLWLFLLLPAFPSSLLPCCSQQHAWVLEQALLSNNFQIGQRRWWAMQLESRACGQEKPSHRRPSGAQQSTCVNNVVHIFLDIKEITGFIEHKFWNWFVNLLHVESPYIHTC